MRTTYHIKPAEDHSSHPIGSIIDESYWQLQLSMFGQSDKVIVNANNNTFIIIYLSMPFDWNCNHNNEPIQP